MLQFETGWVASLPNNPITIRSFGSEGADKPLNSIYILSVMTAEFVDLSSTALTDDGRDDIMTVEVTIDVKKLRLVEVAISSEKISISSIRGWAWPSLLIILKDI